MSKPQAASAPLASIADAAHRLGISSPTLRRIISADPQCPAVIRIRRAVRIDVDAMLTYLRAQPRARPIQSARVSQSALAAAGLARVAR